MEGFTREQVKELETQAKRGSDNSKFFKKVQAIYWRTQGLAWKEIAKLSGLCESTLWKASKAYRKGGLEALRPNYVGSNFRKLPYAEETATLEKLSERATVGKYVRASELLQQFEAISGVSYHIDAFYRLLKRHGWRKVMPRGQHPKKASDEAIEASKKLT